MESKSPVIGTDQSTDCYEPEIMRQQVFPRTIEEYR